MNARFAGFALAGASLVVVFTATVSRTAPPVPASAPVAVTHTITSGKMVASFNPQKGLTEVSVGGKVIGNFDTTAVSGELITLARNTPVLKSEPTPIKGSDVPIPVLWQPVAALHGTGNALKNVTVLVADAHRYTVRHEYEGGIVLTFDHIVSGPDITCRVSIENGSKDYFQLQQWMESSRLTFAKPPERLGGMGYGVYPSATGYSPVAALWDEQNGVGVNWIEHRLRPVEIVCAEDAASPVRDINFKLKNSPIAGGDSSHFAVTFRFGPAKDWKNLLTPYKTWFNEYYGPCTYNVDFRCKLASNPSNASLIKKDNPWGTRNKIDSEGWEPYINGSLAGIKKYPCLASHVIFWSILADPRGCNYRPEFNVFPPVVRETMPKLRAFAREAQIGLGWFARPNSIAYRATWETDGEAGWNMLDPWVVRMADVRYQDMLQMGITGFYMDTYGGHVDYSPNDGEGSVMYLKHLRQMTGPDCLTFIEHGFDAQHVFAMIWPWGKIPKRPIGAYAQWLTPGTAEICRVDNLEQARQAWEEGGMPIVYSLSPELAALQKEYVNADWTSKKRPDCKAAKSPVPPDESFFEAKNAKNKVMDKAE